LSKFVAKTSPEHFPKDHLGNWGAVRLSDVEVIVNMPMITNITIVSVVRQHVSKPSNGSNKVYFLTTFYSSCSPPSLFEDVSYLSNVSFIL